MLSYVNIFAKDVVALSSFYRDVFGFEEITEIRSPIFVGLNTGKSNLGFNAQDAYGLLKLADYANPTGAKFSLKRWKATSETGRRVTLCMLRVLVRL